MEIILKGISIVVVVFVGLFVFYNVLLSSPVYENLENCVDRAEPFYLKWYGGWAFPSVGSIILGEYNGTELKVLRVYRPTWWRKAMVKIGFGDFVRMNQIKVKPVNRS